MKKATAAALANARFEKSPVLTEDAVTELRSSGAFLVAEGRLTEFVTKMVSLEKRARKLEADFQVVVHGSIIRGVVLDESYWARNEEGQFVTQDGEEILRFVRRFFGDRPVVARKSYVVSISGDVKLPGGWEFIATQLASRTTWAGWPIPWFAWLVLGWKRDQPIGMRKGRADVRLRLVTPLLRLS